MGEQDKVSPAQARLQRLMQNRPVSERASGDSAHVTPHVTHHETPHTPNFIVAPSAETSGSAPPERTASTVEADHGAEQTTSLETHHVTKHVMKHVTQEPSCRYTARVRGRWTQAQLRWLKDVAAANSTSAGEVLRHVVAWYLEHGQALPAPAGPTLRPRGMQILDYLTTQDQADAIQEAAQNGEAAWLRLAVDTYREHGRNLAGSH